MSAALAGGATPGYHRRCTSVQTRWRGKNVATIIEQPGYFTSLPRDYYVSQEIFEVELDRVFRRQWLYVGHISQVRDPGDFFTRLVGPESMIVTRDQDGAIRVFYNVCRHRGAQLCET